MRFAGNDGSQTETASDQNRVTALLQRRRAAVEVTDRERLSASEHHTQALVGL
jgi:hypothetical protein